MPARIGTLRGWYETQPPSRYVTFLEHVTKTLNVLLGLAGLCLVALSAYLLLTHTEVPAVVHHGLTEALSRSLAAPAPSPAPAPAHVMSPWMVWVVGANGLAIVAAACAAVTAVNLRSSRLVTCHVAALALLLGNQLCLAVAALTAVKGGLGGSRVAAKVPDAGGGGSDGLGVVASVVGLAAAVVPALESAALALSCLLQAAYGAGEEAMADHADEAEYASQQRRPLLSPNSAVAGSGAQRNDPWSVRMREQYGVDTARLTYDPLQPRHAAAAGHGLTDVAPQLGPSTGAARCALM